MPQPTSADVHVNRPLTNISVAYIQGAERFVADRVFPNIPVAKQSDRYFTYPKGQWFRSDAALRAPSTESAGTGYTVDSTPTYYCPVYALHKDVDDQLLANQDDPLNLDREATLLVTQQLLLKRDQLWVSKFMTTSVWGTDVTGVSSNPSSGQVLQWDASGSDPTKNITYYATKVEEQTGYRPNTLVITPYVEQVLLNHTLILDRIKYTQRGIVSRDLLAALFGVDRVLVAGAIQNTAAEGQNPSLSFVAPKAALLCYVAPTPGLMTPSAGYTFSWNGYLGASAFGSRIKRFRMEHLNSTRIEGEMAFDQKLVGADLGVYFTSIIS